MRRGDRREERRMMHREGRSVGPGPGRAVYSKIDFRGFSAIFLEMRVYLCIIERSDPCFEGISEADRLRNRIRDFSTQRREEHAA